MHFTNKISQYVLEMYNWNHRKTFQFIMIFGCWVMKIDFVTQFGHNDWSSNKNKNYFTSWTLIFSL